MTTEEAKNELVLWRNSNSDNGYHYKFVEALTIAIKALEQGSVLDKIKAEIDQKQYYFMDDKDYDEGIRFGLMLAYQTVDKYKAESEV